MAWLGELWEEKVKPLLLLVLLYACAVIFLAGLYTVFIQPFVE
jgi:hypothetical protein